MKIYFCSVLSFYIHSITMFIIIAEPIKILHSLKRKYFSNILAIPLKLKHLHKLQTIKLITKTYLNLPPNETIQPNIEWKHIWLSSGQAESKYSIFK